MQSAVNFAIKQFKAHRFYPLPSILEELNDMTGCEFTNHVNSPYFRYSMNLLMCIDIDIEVEIKRLKDPESVITKRNLLRDKNVTFLVIQCMYTLNNGGKIPSNIIQCIEKRITLYKQVLQLLKITQ
jgi:hypothetical protein